MAIFLILGTIVAFGIVLMLGRARAEEPGHDDDDDDTPGGPRRIRVRVRSNEQR